MIELKCPIHEDMVQPLEDHFCELTRSSWMLFHEGPGKPHFVMGYFETRTGRKRTRSISSPGTTGGCTGSQPGCAGSTPCPPTPR